MTKKLGRKSEDLAADFLKDRGYKIIEKNYSCRLGEIDIIAKKEDYLVFIEVRSRSKEIFGRPEETVNKRKQRKIREVANHFLYEKNLYDNFCRFDVVSVLWKNQEAKISLFEDAFY